MNAGRTREQMAHDLLQAAFQQSPLDVFEGVAGTGKEGKDELARLKESSDLLVSSRFAKYADDGRTQISITNAGRYWAMNGGFLSFLKEEAPGGGRGRNPEMEAVRLDYMKLRLNTFWWSFGFSVAGFIFALISLAVAVYYGDRLPR